MKYAWDLDPKPSLWKRIRWKISELFDDVRVACGGFRRDLIWCPSQIRKKISTPKGDLELYMRWRWEDPWSAYFVFTKDGETYWSENLFENYFFRDENFHAAERRLMQIYRDWKAGQYIIPMESNEKNKLPASFFQNIRLSERFWENIFEE